MNLATSHAATNYLIHSVCNEGRQRFNSQYPRPIKILPRAVINNYYSSACDDRRPQTTPFE
jgi:hypothetical protein